MANRQNFGSQMSETDQACIWNYQNRDARIHLGTVAENCPIPPMYDTAVSGVSTLSFSNPASIKTNYPMSSFGSGVSSHRTSSGIMQNCYLGPSSSDSSRHFKPNSYLDPSCHDKITIGDCSNIVNPAMENERSRFKRRNPGMPLTCDWGNKIQYYAAGTTLNLDPPSDYLHENQQHCPLDPNIMAPKYHSSNFLNAGEGSQRNVRSRWSHDLQLETLPGTYLSLNAGEGSQRNVRSRWSHDLQLETLPGTYLSRPVPHSVHSTANISAPNVVGQHSYSLDSIPHGRTLPDSRLSSYQMNHSPTGRTTDGSLEINGAHSFCLTNSRNLDAMLPTLHCGLTQEMRMGQNSYGQRPTSYRPVSSYQTMGFATTNLEEVGSSRAEAAAASGYSQPIYAVRQRSERDGRTRGSYVRFQSSYDHDAYDRWLPRGYDMTFDGANNVFDQHGDERLDIDNMSYEELLALEESIGDVSTGLSEGSMSRCLIEMIYCSNDSNDEDEKCAVCLEEYCDGGVLGTLRCEHDFHVHCIKKWLAIKNTCPICKAPALTDTKKEKQVIAL